MIRVVFVCLGNICRSPTAEGVFLDLVDRKGLTERVRIESRGTGGWHVGEPPDPRTQETALRFGVDLSGLRASQFSTYDFEVFDLILVMDEGNRRDVLRLANSDADRAKVKLLMEFAGPGFPRHVPDPYHGGPDGFVQVYQMIEAACEGLLSHLLASSSVTD